MEACLHGSDLVLLSETQLCKCDRVSGRLGQLKHNVKMNSLAVLLLSCLPDQESKTKGLAPFETIPFAMLRPCAL